MGLVITNIINSKLINPNPNPNPNSNSNSSAHLPSQWAIIFSDILYKLGWPAGVYDNKSGSKSEVKLEIEINPNIINSYDFQAINQFNKCLSKLVELDVISGSVSMQYIFLELEKLLNNTVFQIETDDNKIDILGMLEGAGLKYDHLWLLDFY